MTVRRIACSFFLWRAAVAVVASPPAVAAPRPAVEAKRAHYVAALVELRTILAPHIVPLSDRSCIINDLEAIAHALIIAVVGSAALPQPSVPVITALDALNLLCDPSKVIFRPSSMCQRQHHLSLQCFSCLLPAFHPNLLSSPHTWKIWTRPMDSMFEARLPITNALMH